MENGKPRAAGVKAKYKGKSSLFGLFSALMLLEISHRRGKFHSHFYVDGRRGGGTKTGKIPPKEFSRFYRQINIRRGGS